MNIIAVSGKAVSNNATRNGTNSSATQAAMTQQIMAFYREVIAANMTAMTGTRRTLKIFTEPCLEKAWKSVGGAVILAGV